MNPEAYRSLRTPERHSGEPLWQTPLGGLGNSSPVVGMDRVFVTVSRKQPTSSVREEPCVDSTAPTSCRADCATFFRFPPSFGCTLEETAGMVGATSLRRLLPGLPRRSPVRLPLHPAIRVGGRSQQQRGRC